jgi:DNA-binding beta-propeller fold protein YncE
MTLQRIGYINLPPHNKPGGFDHAAVYRRRGRLYVAHTANDALDVIDCAAERYSHSIPNLPGVAGVITSGERGLIFTSNRNENTVSIFTPDNEAGMVRVGVGLKPNGLAYDPATNRLLVANVGDPEIAGSFTVSLVDVDGRKLIGDIPMPGRTRWAIHDSSSGNFFVNIADPAQIAVIDAQKPRQVARLIDVPASGPHGLDVDVQGGRLFCACDGKKLVTLATQTGAVQESRDISGVPDVIFFNPARRHLYVAVGDPGCIDVFDTRSMERIETVATEKGATTLAFDAERNNVCALLPESHRAAVFADQV